MDQSQTVAPCPGEGAGAAAGSTGKAVQLSCAAGPVERELYNIASGYDDRLRAESAETVPTAKGNAPETVVDAASESAPSTKRGPSKGKAIRSSRTAKPVKYTFSKVASSYDDRSRLQRNIANDIRLTADFKTIEQQDEDVRARNVARRAREAAAAAAAAAQPSAEDLKAIKKAQKAWWWMNYGEDLKVNMKRRQRKASKPAPGQIPVLPSRSVKQEPEGEDDVQLAEKHNISGQKRGRGRPRGSGRKQSQT